MNTLKKILVMMGLPASGKSTFAQKYKRENEVSGNGWYTKKTYRIRVIDIDYMREGYMRKRSVEDCILEGMRYDDADEILIDGLFLTNEDIVKIFDNISQEGLELEIHYWNPNRESCLHNDKGRRNESSRITIENAVIKEPNKDFLLEKIKEVSKVTIVKHEVFRKPKWKIVVDELGLSVNSNDELESEEWSLGGTYGNCWDSDLGTISPSEPKSFAELDRFLEVLCPSMTFLQFRDFERECIETKDRSEGDYYGGREDFCYYTCNLPQAYNFLVEKGIIKEEE